MTFKDNKPQTIKQVDNSGNDLPTVNSGQPVVTIKNSAGNEPNIAAMNVLTMGAGFGIETRSLMFTNVAGVGTRWVNGVTDGAGGYFPKSANYQGTNAIDKRGYRATLHIDNLGAVGTYHLVDLSDFATYPHPDPSSDTDIIIRSVKVEINGNTAFRGDIHIGYLSDVDADNGNFEHLMGWHFDLRELTVSEFLRYPAGLAKSGLTNHNLTDDVRFQTDENLTAGLTESPAGNNDLVLLVDLTAGNVDFEIVLEYDIE